MSAYAVLGRRRLGKTTLAYSMAMRCAYQIILDPRNQIHTGAVRVFTVEELREAIRQMMSGTLHEVIFTPRDDLEAAIEYASACVVTWFETMPSSARLMFMIDEGRFFPNAIKYAKSPSLNYVLRAAPPEWIDIAITAHRPADISTDIRSIVDYWMIFRMRQEHDLKVIEARTTAHVRQMVESLEPFQFIEWDDGEADIQKAATIHRRPGDWYIALRSRAEGDAPIIIPPGEPLTVDDGKLF